MISSPHKLTGSIITKRIRRLFSAEFKLEAAQLVLDPNHSIAGARIIADILTKKGIKLSRYRASKLMKELEIVSCQIPKHKYNKEVKEHIEIPNKLNRKFAVTAPNKVWCGDVTYIWIGSRWAYSAIVMDLFSRKPIGWAMSLSPDSTLTGKALSIAFESRGRPKNVMFHSDQGCHYTS